MQYTIRLKMNLNICKIGVDLNTVNDYNLFENLSKEWK